MLLPFLDLLTGLLDFTREKAKVSVMRKEIMLKNLQEAFTLSGVGLHSGLITTVKVMPSKPGTGRYFVRVDKPEQPIIPANLDSVSQTTLSTELACSSCETSISPIPPFKDKRGQASSQSLVTVRTVEHLLAALSASGIEDARIEIDGAEVPLLDGSAKLWADAILERSAAPSGRAAPSGGKGGSNKSGATPSGFPRLGNAHQETGLTSDTNSSITESPHPGAAPSGRASQAQAQAQRAENTQNNQIVEHHPHPSIAIQQTIVVQEKDSFVAAIPAPETRFTYGIEFPYDAIGNQWHSWTLNRENFATEIAPARTFGFAEEIEQLQQAGLIKGGSLDNALVCSHQGWLNPPLRFTNEPARHKLLDLVGDLSLLGTFPQAHFIAYKASHKLHIQLAKKISLLIANG